MDDRTWYLAVGTLAAGVFIATLDAVLGKNFDTPPGFFPFLGVVLGFLGGVMAYKTRNGRLPDEGVPPDDTNP